MWRIFNGIPRAFRQHFHGPRAAAGICKEEEQFAEHEANSTDFCSWFGETRRCASSPPESRIKEKENGPGADREQNDWWKSNCHREWSCFGGNHSALEAVTWGAAVVLGIQLSRPRWSEGSIQVPPLNSGGQPRRRSLLCQVAFALPGQPTTTNSVKSTKVLQNDATKAEKQDGFGQVMKDFEDICKKYTAVGKSVLGLTKAEEGNMTGAVKHLREASMLGHASAQFNLGLCFETGQGVDVDLQKAAECYHMAGEDGHAHALYNLALLYLKGEGGVEQDTRKAMALLEQSAQHGLSQAQTYLGVYYTEDEQQDMEKAAKFFTLAAEQNDPEAQYFLGICYEQGWGVEMDQHKASQLYTLSAQNGHDGAMYNLGVFHEYGLGGIPKDHVSACGLYSKASAKGNEDAAAKLLEWDKQTALQDWKVEKDDNLKPKMDRLAAKESLSPSASSPSLTEYVRQHIGQLGFGPGPPGITPLLFQTNLPLPTPQKQKSKSREVLFYLGEEDEDMSSVIDTPDSGYGSPSALTPNYSLLCMQRNATMPNLRSASLP